jgi:hypothetical protein
MLLRPARSRYHDHYSFLENDMSENVPQTLPRQDPQTVENLAPAEGDSDGKKATKLELLAGQENAYHSLAFQYVNAGTDQAKVVEL